MQRVKIARLGCPTSSILSGSSLGCSQQRYVLSPQSFFQSSPVSGTDSSFLAAFKSLREADVKNLRRPLRTGGGFRESNRVTEFGDVINPYEGLRIQRTEENPPLSIDADPRKLREELLDGGPRRCRLCAESFKDAPYLHQSFVPHTAREAIAGELLRAYCGEPDKIADMWWWRLHHSVRFQRIHSLSSNDHEERRRRLFYLLEFLRDRQIIKECFNVSGAAAGVGAGRSWEFERLEWVGDNVVKYCFSDRMSLLFPLAEGGLRGRLVFFNSLLDGNDGLARAYDHLGFEKLTGSDKVVSKFKSDVVEALFGELQVYLWSTELDYSPDAYDLPMGNEFVPIRAIVRHVMEEVAHNMVMYHVRHVLGVIKDLVKEKNYSFIKTDPGLRDFSSGSGGFSRRGKIPRSDASSSATPSGTPDDAKPSRPPQLVLSSGPQPKPQQSVTSSSATLDQVLPMVRCSGLSASPRALPGSTGTDAKVVKGECDYLERLTRTPLDRPLSSALWKDPVDSGSAVDAAPRVPHDVAETPSKVSDGAIAARVGEPLVEQVLGSLLPEPETAVA
jgi:hypothetical protein